MHASEDHKHAFAIIWVAYSLLCIDIKSNLEAARYGVSSIHCTTFRSAKSLLHFWSDLVGTAQKSLDRTYPTLASCPSDRGVGVGYGCLFCPKEPHCIQKGSSTTYTADWSKVVSLQAWYILVGVLLLSRGGKAMLIPFISVERSNVVQSERQLFF